ncbi:MAG: cell division protein ZipA [Gammaproteobacteria bacterium]|nr:MAG: cell division protein ZipA [Gammaproteobacteria bacterium]
MDGLRWLLLFFGLVVVVGVYFYSRREQKSQQESESFERRTPSLVGEEAGSGDDIEAAGIVLADEAAQGGDEAEPEAQAQAEQKIVTLRLVARNRGSFRGDDLILSMRGIGLRRGKFGIFHRFDGDEEGAAVFSAASLVEPGHFDVENIKEQEFPGISLFLVLPGPMEGVDAFDLMIAAARTLAQALNGELVDESGSTLSIQRERYMREEIVQFEHDNKVA